MRTSPFQSTIPRDHRAAGQQRCSPSRSLSIPFPLRILLLAGLGTALLLIPHTPAPARAGLEELSHYQRLGGITSAVAVGSEHVYAVVGSQLFTYRAAAPKADNGAPTLAGPATSLPDVAEAIGLMDDRLFVASRATGGQGQASLQVFGLIEGKGLPTALAAPLALDAREVGAIALHYPRAYLLTERSLIIVDVKNPDAPRVSRSLALTPPNDAKGEARWRGALRFWQGQLYIGRDWGLYRLDLRAPYLRIEPLDTRPSSRMAIADTLLVTAGEGGRIDLRRLDADARPIRSWNSEAPSIQALAWSTRERKLLALTDEGRSLRRFQLEAVDAPREIGQPIWLTRSRSDHAELALVESASAGQGVRLLIALERGGLFQVDADACPACVERLEPWLPPAQSLNLNEGRILASAGDAGLFMFAPSDGSEHEGSGTDDTARSGILSAHQGIQLVEELEGGPKVLPAGQIPAAGRTPGRSLDLVAAAARGSMLYALSAEDGMFVIDLDAGAFGEVIGRLPELRIAPNTAPLLVGDTLYLAREDGSLVALDLREAGAPRFQAVMQGLDARGLSWTSDPDRLLVSGAGALGGGLFSILDPHAPGGPRVLGQVSLDRYHEQLRVSQGFAYLSGQSGLLEVVDLRDAAKPLRMDRLRLRGMTTGSIGRRGSILLAAQSGFIDILQQMPSGALMPLARTNLPSAGSAWAGQTHVAMFDGDAVLLRGRSGLFVAEAGWSEGPDDRPAPPAQQGASELERRFLPSVAKGYARSSDPRSRPAKRACEAPELVVLALDLPNLDADVHREALSGFADALAPSVQTLALAHFDHQAQLLAAGPPADLANAIRSGALAWSVAAAQGNDDRASAGSAGEGTRVDLALAMARKHAESSGVLQSGDEHSDPSQGAALGLVSSRPSAARARALAAEEAQAMARKGWRIKMAIQEAASDPFRLVSMNLDAAFPPETGGKVTLFGDFISSLAPLATDLIDCP